MVTLKDPVLGSPGIPEEKHSIKFLQYWADNMALEYFFTSFMALKSFCDSFICVQTKNIHPIFKLSYR